MGAHGPVVGGAVRRGGFAVPLALLLLLAVGGLVHGALLLARREATTSRLAATLLARELALRGALLTAAARPDTLPALAPGEGALLSSAAGTPDTAPVRVERLAAEYHLLVASPPEGEGAGSIGLVVWALDPATRAGFKGAAAADVACASDASGPAGGAPRGEAGAPPPTSGAASSGGAPSPGAAPGTGPPGPPGIGLLPGDTVLARAPVRVASPVTPRPGEDPWRCPVERPDAWGAPGRARHPCADHRPFVSTPGDLVVEGGEGQGVVATGGDLTLRGTRFDGVLLAGGTIRLEGGAAVRGRVGAGRGVVVDGASTFAPAACPVYRALRAATALRLPFVLPGGAWIRPI